MDLLFIYLLIGPIFLIAGLALSLFPPKKINGLYGYRTNLSMADQRYWDFSQRYSGRIMIVGGLALLATGILLRSLDINVKTGIIVALILLLTKVVLLVILTERAIRNKFNLTKKPDDTLL